MSAVEKMWSKLSVLQDVSKAVAPHSKLFSEKTDVIFKGNVLVSNSNSTGTRIKHLTH